MNRFQLQQMLNGVQSDLQSAANKLNSMYADAKTTAEQRREQKDLVQDLEERESGLKAQLNKLDEEAAAKLAGQEKGSIVKNENEKAIANKAAVIRNIMSGNKAGANESIKALGGSYVVNALSTNTESGQGGSSLLPRTTANEVITEPVYENDLREHIIITSESKLEVPKLLFSCDDDGFVADEETAKEIKANGSTVSFGAYKSKLKAKVSETVILGSDINLVSTVDSALSGAAAYKEAKMLFSESTDDYHESHMSFYGEDSKSQNLIPVISGKTKYLAIRSAIAKLPKMFRKNAKVVMTYEDYLEIIDALSNGTTNFFNAPPEMVLGKPAIFMDEATTPIVGDLKYLQINYNPETLYDRDKDIDSGIEEFVLTNWFDIQFRLRSAFRLAKVTP